MPLPNESRFTGPSLCRRILGGIKSRGTFMIATDDEVPVASVSTLPPNADPCDSVGASDTRIHVVTQLFVTHGYDTHAGHRVCCKVLRPRSPGVSSDRFITILVAHVLYLPQSPRSAMRLWLRRFHEAGEPPCATKNFVKNKLDGLGLPASHHDLPLLRIRQCSRAALWNDHNTIIVHIWFCDRNHKAYPFCT